MALRNIVTEEDEILRKKSREVEKVNARILTLLDDMWETMLEYDGAGLAAPQVGVLRRVVVVDFKPPGDDGEHVKLELINPVIIEKEGEVLDQEGCLSVPGKLGNVKRPQKVKIKALDRNENDIEVEAEDFLAKALCHEIDHLDGILYIDIAEETEVV